MFEEHWAGKARQREEKDEEERDDRSELEREKQEAERESWKGERRQRREGKEMEERGAELERRAPSMVAGEEKTRAFLVITSSAPLFEAHRDKRAAIYWSPGIMATFIYFHPFSFCQGLSSVWAKNRNPRCFTKYRRPLPSFYMSGLYLFVEITTIKKKNSYAGVMCICWSTCGHIYIWPAFNPPPGQGAHTHTLICRQKGHPSRPGLDVVDPLSWGGTAEKTASLSSLLTFRRELHCYQTWTKL